MHFTHFHFELDFPLWVEFELSAEKAQFLKTKQQIINILMKIEAHLQRSFREYRYMQGYAGTSMDIEGNEGACREYR